MQTYSTYEAKAKFSEVIRKVRAGQKVVISYRGKEIAEIRPIKGIGGGLARSIERLEEEGVLSKPQRAIGRLEPIAKTPGALTRFLESRE